MNTTSSGFVFSLPYEIAVVRPLRQTSPAERDSALRAAHFNVELIPQDLIYIDLCTDSGISSSTTRQLAAIAAPSELEPGMGLAAEGSRAFGALADEVHRVFGFSYVVATPQGRAAERIWTKIHVRPNTFVVGNLLFPSTRVHIEMNGAKVIEAAADAAYDLTSDEPFKGNLDVQKLQRAIEEKGADHVSCIYVELSDNACGGHPLSLANLRAIKEIAAAHQLPLFLDACRILENSYLIQRREVGYQERTILEIVRATCDLADGCTLSALKDFLVSSGGLILSRNKESYQKASMQAFLDGAQLPGLAMMQLAISLRDIFAADNYIKSRVEQVRYLWQRLKDRIPVVSPPGGHAVFIDVKAFLPDLQSAEFRSEALGAFLYRYAGIRVTKGPPPAPSQAARGMELLRLAIPARKYLNAHLDDVAEALCYAYSRRNEITGLKRSEDPARSKYDPAYFQPL
jgi:tyrosine phenol-lyase